MIEDENSIILAELDLNHVSQIDGHLLNEIRQSAGPEVKFVIHKLTSSICVE